jgi:uncharacterized membrane protein YgcG
MNRKYILWVLALLLMVSGRSAHAQGKEPPIPVAPPEGRHVLDTLNWFSKGQEEDVNRIVDQLDRDGIADIFVVTLDDCGEDKRNYRKAILQNWGIGQASGNNGLLILVCWYGGDTSRRSVEQEFGPSLNGSLSSEITNRVAKEQFIPSFNDDHPGDGLLAMVVYYDALLRAPKEIKESSQPSQVSNSTIDPFYIFLLGGFVVIFLISFFVDKKNGSRSENYYGGDYREGSGDGGGASGGDSGSSTSF